MDDLTTTRDVEFPEWESWDRPYYGNSSEFPHRVRKYRGGGYTGGICITGEKFRGPAKGIVLSQAITDGAR